MSVAKPGSWPDADMLPLGRIGIRAERGDNRVSRFKHHKQRTLMTLWAIVRSPLMYGGDLPRNDEFSLSLLTNDEVLEANRRSANSRQLSADGNQIVWISDAPGSTAKFIAVFNVGDAAEKHQTRLYSNWNIVGRFARPVGEENREYKSGPVHLSSGVARLRVL